MLHGNAWLTRTPDQHAGPSGPGASTSSGLFVSDAAAADDSLSFAADPHDAAWSDAEFFEASHGPWKPVARQRPTTPWTPAAAPPVSATGRLRKVLLKFRHLVASGPAAAKLKRQRLR